MNRLEEETVADEDSSEDDDLPEEDDCDDEEILEDEDCLESEEVVSELLLETWLPDVGFAELLLVVEGSWKELLLDSSAEEKTVV